MSIVYLNGEFVPVEMAKISPLDRGFLFGDGVYEFIPSYGGRTIGLDYHIQRLENGLREVAINLATINWRFVVEQLIEINHGSNLGIYIQISRGADDKRTHQFPLNVKPTVFAMTQPIAKLVTADRRKAAGFSLVSTFDQRWRRCHIKSTSLLGNIMHFQQGFDRGVDEILLFNQKKELTECSACNVFVVNNNEVSTPLLDNQILPGVTRRLVIEAVNKDPDLKLFERIVTLNDAVNADEIWITSSTKQIAPIVRLDGLKVGTGQVGPIWQRCQELYDGIKFD
jgi:D-alanine transaminase